MFIKVQIVGPEKTFSFDLKIKGKPILIEIDGDYWHGGPGVSKHFIKVDKVKENDIYKNELAAQKGYKVIRIWESELKLRPEILLEKIDA